MRVPTVEVPPILRVAFAACVKPPVPIRAVATVNVLLLVNTVGEVTVMLGIVNVPVSACELVSNVCTPEPAVKVGLVVIPPRNVMGEFPELFQVPPALIVTKPVKILVPVAEEMTKVPVVPAPTVVVPDTVKAKPAAVKVVPFPILRLPLTTKLAAVAAVAVLLSVRLPPMVVIAPNVSAPPLRVRL